MKRLSDYTGNDAIELWADILDPLTAILGDGKVRAAIQSKVSALTIAKVILENRSKEAESILTRIDDTPINGLNILTRLIALLADIGSSDDVKGFFGFAEQEKTVKESSGSPTESIKA